MIFAPETLETTYTQGESKKILIVDDDSDVIGVSVLAFKSIKFPGIQSEVMFCDTTADAKRLIKENPDIAIVLLDIMMETDHSGLDIIQYIRNDLKNVTISIVVRSGQPSFHAEDLDIVKKYDIDGYLPKQITRLPDMALALNLAMRRHIKMKMLHDANINVLTRMNEICMLLMNNATFHNGVIDLNKELDGKGEWFRDQFEACTLLISEELKGGI